MDYGMDCSECDKLFSLEGLEGLESLVGNPKFLNPLTHLNLLNPLN